MANGHRDTDPLVTELAQQIESEMARGIALWPDPAWNEAAWAFVTESHGPVEALSATQARAAHHKAATPPPVKPAATPAKPAKQKKAPTFGPPPPVEGRDKDWAAQLEKVRADAKSCTGCPLAETRTNVVVDSGSGKVGLVFVGEAPGADEDAQGEAFVGRAGQLLTKIIAAIGLDRADTYICNVIKCRPPGNRNPTPAEITACSPYLLRQLEILKPSVICTLGLFATQLLLDSKAPIGTLRGRLFRYHGIPMIPTYHPAALLRNPNLKRTVWEDVQLLRKVLDEGPGEIEPAVPLTERIVKPSGPKSGDLFSGAKE